MLELTVKERAKVVLKRFLSIVFTMLGGFHLARWMTGPSVSIIAYHRIIEDDFDGICPYISVRRSDFLRQVRFFKRFYSVISLDEAVDRISRNLVDKRYLAITFDDGYLDNYSLGLDIFEREAIHPAVFVTTGCVERQEALWPDKVRQLLYGAIIEQPVALPELSVALVPESAGRVRAVHAVIAHLKKMDLASRSQYLEDLKGQLGNVVDAGRLMLAWDEVKILGERGVLIGAHSVNHPVLASVSEQVAAAEIGDSKAMLEEKTGSAVTLFAYPNGTVADFTELTVRQLKHAGYKAAVTTIRGVNRNGEDVFRLRRTGVYLTDTLSDIKFKLALESFLSCGNTVG